MNNILQTILVALLPAVTTGLVTYLVSSKTLKSEMEKIHSEHEHDLKVSSATLSRYRIHQRST